ncbi:MAG: cytochrome P450 [Chloroflexota bacterium]|jgi:cytochrome P450
MSRDLYDLFSPRFKADPFPTYAAMRRDHPIYRHTAPDGRVIWYMTRYEDISAVLRDDLRFGKDPVLAKAGSEGSVKLPKLGSTINDNMLFSDPPDHTRLRALVNQAFTPRRVAAMTGRIQDTAEGLLEKCLKDGMADLISTYALPLPVVVISDLLGIPAHDRDVVAQWSQAIISPGNRGLTYRGRKQNIRAFIHYLRDLFVQRQIDPQDDLITALVQAEEAGERLGETELLSMIALLLVTGHETTVNLIGNGTLALLRHPEQQERLRADPSLWPRAVEELLRFDGPVETSTSRWVRRDTIFKGHHMAGGELVRAAIASANRDADYFDRPDDLDVGRKDNRHLAFGLGTHYCLGAPLARLEGLIALETLFRRLPDLRLRTAVDDLTWRSGTLLRGMACLPVAWK